MEFESVHCILHRIGQDRTRENMEINEDLLSDFQKQCNLWYYLFMLFRDSNQRPPLSTTMCREHRRHRIQCYGIECFNEQAVYRLAPICSYRSAQMRSCSCEMQHASHDFSTCVTEQHKANRTLCTAELCVHCYSVRGWQWFVPTRQSPMLTLRR